MSIMPVVDGCLRRYSFTVSKSDEETERAKLRSIFTERVRTAYESALSRGLVSSLNDVGKKAGIQNGAFNKYFNGERDGSNTATIRKIADVLQVNVEWLEFGTGEMLPEPRETSVDLDPSVGDGPMILFSSHPNWGPSLKRARARWPATLVY